MPFEIFLGAVFGILAQAIRYHHARFLKGD